MMDDCRFSARRQSVSQEIGLQLGIRRHQVFNMRISMDIDIGLRSDQARYKV